MELKGTARCINGNKVAIIKGKPESDFLINPAAYKQCRRRTTMKQNIGSEYNRSFFRYVLIAVIIFLIFNHDFIFRKKEPVIEW